MKKINLLVFSLFVTTILSVHSNTDDANWGDSVLDENPLNITNTKQSEKNTLDNFSDDENLLTQNLNTEKEIVNKMLNYQFKFNAGPNLEDSVLTSTGFQSDQANSIGNFKTFTTRFWDEEFKKSLYFNLLKSNTSFSQGQSLTPQKVNLKRTEYKLGFSNKFWQNNEIDFFSNLAVRGGYFYYDQDTSRTYPNQSISAFTAHGFIVGLGYENKITDSINYELVSDAYIPISYKETLSVTGKFENAIGVRMEAMINFILKRNFALGTGVNYRYEEYKFSGTGNRGTTNAKVTQTNLMIPIEAILMF